MGILTKKDSIRILIVEDMPIIAEDMRETLLMLGYKNADVAITDGDVLNLNRENKYDLIFMDIKLEGSTMDGIELSRIINNDIPIIYCTAYSDSDTIRKIIRSPHLSYILKPFEVEKIKDILDAVLLQSGSKR